MSKKVNKLEQAFVNFALSRDHKTRETRKISDSITINLSGRDLLFEQYVAIRDTTTLKVDLEKIGRFIFIKEEFDRQKYEAKIYRDKLNKNLQ